MAAAAPLRNDNSERLQQRLVELSLRVTDMENKLAAQGEEKSKLTSVIAHLESRVTELNGKTPDL